ncbi:hypothetical protein, partial [Paraburkholderia sp. BL25I1N1]
QPGAFDGETQAQRISHVPTHARQHHIKRVMETFEHSATAGFNVVIKLSVVYIIPYIIGDQPIATKPATL